MIVKSCPSCGKRMVYIPDRDRLVGLDDETGKEVVILEPRHYECDCGRWIPVKEDEHVPTTRND